MPPSASDHGEEAPPDLPPDLPTASSCDDGVAQAAELCFDSLALDVAVSEVHIGDLDGDGLDDIAAFSLSGSDYVASLLRANGIGSFEGMGEFTLEDIVATNSRPKLAHVNDDGLMDIIGVQLSEGRVSVHLNGGQGSFTPGPTSQIAGAGEPWNSAIVFDLDSDGLDDLIVEPDDGAGTLHLLENIGNDEFASTASMAPAAVGCFFTADEPMPAYSGFNGGVLFLPGECEGVQNSAVSLILAQQGGNTVSGVTPTSGARPAKIVAGDFEGDGAPEVIIWDLQLRRFQVLRADPFGGLDPVAEMSMLELCASCTDEDAALLQLESGQFDGDATGDLVLVSGTELHFGLNPLTEQAHWEMWAELEAPILEIGVSTFNGDGNDDIIIISTSDTMSQVLVSKS